MTSTPKPSKKKRSEPSAAANDRRLVIITGLSGSGKGTVLKGLEDSGYYSVDNLPIDLVPQFAEFARTSPTIRHSALVIDVREGGALRRFPAIYKKIRQTIPSTLVFLEAAEDSLVRRFSETRRPHPLGTHRSVPVSIQSEREQLKSIRALADHIIDTSRFNVHELRDTILQKFEATRDASTLMVNVNSFGFKHGVPTDSDLVFDVRFLPNPNYIPEFKDLTGRDPKVAEYIQGFPQTREFIEKITQLLIYLMPHYVREGKSYLTISFGCTGGHHRSVMIARHVRQKLLKAGYKVKETHRDILK